MTGVVLAGHGFVAHWHARAIAASDRLRLAAVVGRDRGRAEGFCRVHGGEAYDDLAAALARADAGFLLVATPNAAHDEAVCAAIRRGVPVLCDKPLAVSCARTRALVREARAAGVPLGVVCQTRWTPAYAEVRRAVREGRLGRITFARVDLGTWYPQEYFDSSPWHGSREMDGGSLYTQGVHMLDWLTDLMPPVAEVRGFTAMLGHERIETEDVVSAALRFEGGALGAVYVSTASWPGRPRRLEVTGTRGTVAIEDYHIATWALADGSQPSVPPPVPVTGFAVPPAGGMDVEQIRACFEAFERSLAGGEAYPVDGAAAIATADLIERIYS